MRILIPNYRIEDSFVDNVQHTLTKMGHEVFLVPSPPWARTEKLFHLWSLAAHTILPDRLNHQERWVRRHLNRIRPDLVLSLTFEMHEGLLAKFRSRGIVTMNWWGDTPANMQGKGLLCDGWDFIFLKDRAAVRKLAGLGLNARYLPEAMNPDWHTRNYTRITTDIVFAGNLYNYRHLLIRELLRRGVQDIRIYGNRAPRWADAAIREQHSGMYIVKLRKSEVFGGALACVNSTAMNEGDSLNCRAFEIAGACGLQIIENKPAIEDCFEPHTEVLPYNDVDELIEHIKFAERDPRAAQRIREAGYHRAQNHHTYEHRLRFMLGLMAT